MTVSPVDATTEIEELRRENAELRRALEDRKLIEQAKGLVMEWEGCPEREAHRRLQKASMDTGRPLVDIARTVLLVDQARDQAARRALQRRLHLDRHVAR